MPSPSLLKLVILISGTGSNLKSIISYIRDGKLNASIQAVISNKAEASGLGYAIQNDIPTIVVKPHPGEDRETYDARLAAVIDQYDPELIVCAGFMRIFSDILVQRYLGKMINIHPSLLPKHRGLYTHRRALEAGDRIHGASIHFVTPELDGGPVIMQAQVPVMPDDTEQSLAQRVLQVEHRLYPESIQYFSKGRIRLHNDRVIVDGKVLHEPIMMETA